jgi:hypothetical protein
MKKITEKEIKEADLAIRKAKKEIKEAEKATDNAQKEVLDVAIVSKGNKRKKVAEAARDLEKATSLVSESCESTEEAEFKFRESKK